MTNSKSSHRLPSTPQRGSSHSMILFARVEAELHGHTEVRLRTSCQ